MTTFCTTFPCEQMIYIYLERNIWAYPSVKHGSVEQNVTYKIRVNAEKSI